VRRFDSAISAVASRVAGASDISRKDRTEYLVLRKYPFARAIEFPPSLSGGSGPRASAETRQALSAYRAELAALSSEEITQRYVAEKQREYQQAVEKAEREERERFFNLPRANADYDHWSKAAHWTLDEAIALSFGRAPEVVRWDQLQKFTLLGSPFVTQYARRRDLAMRALAWKQLYDPVLPGIFLAWAKRTDIPVPPELTEAVEKRGVQVADWKSLHDEAVEAGKRDAEAAEKQIAEWQRLFNETIAQLEKQDADWLEVVNAKNAKIAALEADIEILRSQQPAFKPEQGVGARERDSLLKLIIGMAVAGYVYDPKVTRSDKPAEIADDLARAGVPLDVDTVRKWLREAAELLPPK
jgi:hypothetical protein